MKISIFFVCTSLVSSGSVYTPSQCLCNSLCHSSLSSVNVPSTYNSDNDILFIFFRPSIILLFHQVTCPGFPRLFLEHSSFDHFCAPCSCFFTYILILRRLFHCFVSLIFVVCCTSPAASSIAFCIVLKISSPVLFTTGFLNSILASSFRGLHPVHFSSSSSQGSNSSPHFMRPDDVIQLRRSWFSFIFKVSVREGQSFYPANHKRANLPP